ncbi:MAG: response regulator transcription factor [Clostridiales bacterium]|nr:response regulator transcription factor [Clostridiales bacterium]
MYNVIICDHQLSTGIQIEKLLRSDFPGEFEIFVTDNPRLVMRNALTRQADLDILIIDTEVRDFSGIDIAEDIKKTNPNTQVIFESVHHKYAQDIFRASPVYFLNKPVQEDLLKIAIERCKEKLDLVDRKALTLKKSGRVYHFVCRDILYIESSKRLVTIHTINQDVEMYCRLDQIEDLLDASFLRCHQSYIVNMDCIRVFQKNNFILKNGSPIPISQSRFTDVRDRYEVFRENPDAM